MGRNGIVYLRLHTIVEKILAQFVAMGAQNGEDMIYRIAGREKYSRMVVDYFSLIASGNLTATLVVGIQMGQLSQQNGGLYLVDA